ncbi:MAG: hypothetical protein K2W85_12080 [Phycisphaerales bacterium]|nr:hypothetical protein [Phycisphaerales bacterium]
MWSIDAIADALIDALQTQESELRAEQAVYGLDALAEVDIHPLLASGLERAGLGVLREHPYPHEWLAKKPSSKSRIGLPEHRDRQRCDLVLTPSPGQRLNDALHNERSRREEADRLRGSLFESIATPPTTSRDPALLDPEDALWLEIKLVNQFCVSSGVPGPNRTYSSELTRNPVADLRKLADDHRIVHAGVAVVLCACDEPTARHDLGVLAHKCLDRNLPIAIPAFRATPIQDRIGNAVCALGLLTMRSLTRSTLEMPDVYPPQ